MIRILPPIPFPRKILIHQVVWFSKQSSWFSEGRHIASGSQLGLRNRFQIDIFLENEYMAKFGALIDSPYKSLLNVKP